ncbi:hypothetical protein RND81_13G109300 [Saponaria officinalis]|uniref:Uncharacterized protein n=1 Tax=Saponaria officinalis TaxID=3572 RepID=A0AAW1GW68_SAPOF
MRWERLKSRGVGPGKRWGHTCNAINGGKMVYVFGGYGLYNSHSNKLHVFYSESQTWSELVVKGAPPTPRDSHTCSTIDDNLFVFGGTNGTNPLNDLHMFNTSSNTWICPYVRGDAPEAREGHSAAVVGKRLFIFGGCGKYTNHSCEVHYNDLYILDTESFVWQRASTSGILPTARDSHTCLSWKNKIIVIGGEDEHDYYLSDVHVLDTDTLIWKKLNTAGQLLPPRAGHSSVAFGKHILVFGGFSDDQNLYDDLHMLDVDTGIWTKINPDGDKPSARFSMSGDCLDPSKDGVLLFVGGCDRNLEALGDIYYLHTGLERDVGRDERRLEKLSHRNLQSQEQDVPSLANDRALVTVGTADHESPFSLPHHSLPSRQYFHLNMYRPAVGKRTFQAKVTKNFSNGFTIETIIDGKPFRGILFSTSSSANLSPNRDANNAAQKASEKQDPVSRSPTSHQPCTELTNASALKELALPSSGQLQEVVIKDSKDPATPEANTTDQAANTLNVSVVGEVNSSLPSSQVAEGQVLTGDRS